MTETSELVARLRAEAERLSGNSLKNGCAGCGIAANVAAEAADWIDTLTAEKAPRTAEARIAELERERDDLSQAWRQELDEVARLRSAAESARDVLQRYYEETPLGHQPHMIAQKTVDVLADLAAALTGPAPRDQKQTPK